MSDQTISNAWDDYAEAPQTEWESQEGARRITHLNPDSKKMNVVVDGKSFAIAGGFTAKTSAGTWRFGTEVDMAHGEKTEKEIAAHVLRNVVILGWSPRHLTLMGRPDGENFVSRYVADYTDVPFKYAAANKESKYGFKVTAERVYYVAFLDDPDLKVHSLVVRGNSATESATNIESVIIRAAQRISFLIEKETGRKFKLGVFGVKVNISTTEPHLTGKGENKSMITPVVLDVATLDDAELRKFRLVPGKTYKRLAEISAEVKEIVEVKTDWIGKPTLETLVALLQAPTQPQLPAGDEDALEEEPQAPAPAQPAPATNPEDNITLGVYVSSEENTFAWYDYLKLKGLTVKLALSKLKESFPAYKFETFGACDVPLSECRAAIES